MELHVYEGKFLLPNRLFFSILFMILIVPLCLSPDLGSKRLVYTNWLSVGLYVLWIIAIATAHSLGTLETNTVVIPRGRLFQDISTPFFLSLMNSFESAFLSNHCIRIRVSVDFTAVSIVDKLWEQIKRAERFQKGQAISFDIIHVIASQCRCVWCSPSVTVAKSKKGRPERP